MLMIIEVVLSDFLRVWWVRSVRTPNYEAWFFKIMICFVLIRIVCF